LISSSTTYPQSENLQAVLTGETLTGYVT